jgi:hypothetical protein
MSAYQSPDITGNEAAVKAVLKDFLVAASNNPNFNLDTAVHDATVYVMGHLPPGVTRVDGAVIAPLLLQTAEDLLNVPDEPEPPKQNAFMRTVKNIWSKLFFKR